MAQNSKWLRLEAAAIALLLAFRPSIVWAKSLPLVFNCARDNDLYRTLMAAGDLYPRYDSPAEAIAKAAPGSGVLLLADGYPYQTMQLDVGLFEQAAKRKLRVYVEYPSWLPGLEVGKPRRTNWERGVVASDVFGPALQRLRIIAIHDCRFAPVRAEKADIVLARVAGFDTAIYGLPQRDVYPILFEHPQGDILVSTTKLSQFVTARYAPTDAWAPIWKRVLSWLCPGQEVPELKWTPSVRPSFALDERLPEDVELRAFRQGVAWYSKARLFVHPSWRDKFDAAGKYPDRVGRGPRIDWPLGDGSEGVLEGFSSNIQHDGRQLVRWYLRGDCVGEVSMAMALSSLIDRRPEEARMAANLNDFIYFKSLLAKGPRNDPGSPSFGLIGWRLPDASGVYYGDDNARSLLGTMTAAAALKSDRWDEHLLRCLLANLRTTGRRGFRGNRLEEALLKGRGWQHFYNRDLINYAPHYEAYLWACFLWAYHKTGYKPFLERAKNAIGMTVDTYPRGWRWTNGIQQERARMLLPLAWLVRVEDTLEHRSWLRRIAKDLLALQDESGAIREELGPEGKGRYGPPKSNEEYGTSEATLIQRNGDPVCDLLYTANFAFLGLHEAAAATSERIYVDASEKLARFLCRVQVRSESHPELDGAWFRAFDYKKWDYWASNSDSGWGAWSAETGWTQAWITSVLAMRHMKTSLWGLTASSQIRKHMQKLLPLMFDKVP